MLAPNFSKADAPASYKERQKKFNQLITREKNRTSLTKLAIAMAKDPGSEFRIDAINLLAEVKPKEAVEPLLDASKDPNVREFAIFALGEIPSEKPIPQLIKFLDDPSENVRGNAYQALRKILGLNFRYDYTSAGLKRKEGIADIQSWWDHNKENFKVRERTPEELKAAEQNWEIYGKQYIHDLDR